MAAPPPSVSSRFRGGLYALLWYSSILLGFYFLYAPLLPLLFVHRGFYRKATDVLFTLWESFNVSLLDLVFGVRFVHSGDLFLSSERSIIVLNHRTRVDWNFLWAALLHQSHPPAHNAKLVLKDEVKAIPGLGWTMQMARFLYISRHWKTDEGRMYRMIEYLSSSADQSSFQLVLFPEGTNLTEKTRAKSNAFAKAQGLKPFAKVLHPRTTGFGFLVEKMRERNSLDAVYDVTIAYPDSIPETEKELIEGQIPREIQFYVKRYPAQAVPSTIVGLEKWLQELWSAKESLLTQLEDNPGEVARGEAQTILPLQYLSLAAWLGFLYYSLFQLLLSASGLLWVCLVSGVMYAVSKYTDGLQEVEVSLDQIGLFKTVLEVLRNWSDRSKARTEASKKRD